MVNRQPGIPFAVANWVSQILSGVLSSWALLCVQFAFLLFLQRESLSSVWEVQHGALGLLPSWMLLMAPLGALGGVMAWTLVHRPGSARFAFGCAALIWGVATGWGVGGGRHLASFETRGGFALVLGLVAALCAVLCVGLLIRAASARRGRLYLAAGAGVTWIVLESANSLLLVRLYPAFHLSLSVSASTIGALGLVLVSPGHGKRGQRNLLIVTAAGLVSLLLWAPASRTVRGFDNFRWVVSENSPTLDWGVRVASLLAPPPPLDPKLKARPLGSRAQTSHLDFRGRNIVLISIDALRADHLGTYGYHRKTSPHLDQLAAEGVRFEAAYAPTPHTSYSVTSLMTGKYMRPLLLQGTGTDSDLWAGLLQTYGFRTAAFYPPAVFFIDTPRFEPFQKNNLGFEYAKVEFAEGAKRIHQIESYLRELPPDKNLFLWVHLFGPHEPYEKDTRFDFGEADIDLYDSEVRSADETLGRVVSLVRKRTPEALVIVTADHGEEFGDHGGRYHGTSVYDEQVRVPLIIAGSGVTPGLRVPQPVQTIDLLPTVLEGLKIPIPPRIRGRSLSGLLQQPISLDEDTGRAVSETDDFSLIAERNHRLICQRRTGACQLYDVVADPSQTTDQARKLPRVAGELRERARRIAESHGTYESEGLRAEGKGWPTPILLGLSGDASVVGELAMLLDDAEVSIRRKSAELLFSLGTTAQTPALRLALTREEDQETKAWLALALTSLGQGAPLVQELLNDRNLRFRRLAALALGEQGDDAGESELVRWWSEDQSLEFGTAKRLLQAFAKIRSKKSIQALIASLDDVRLRPLVAEALARIGDKDALPHLTLQFQNERYHSTRGPLALAMIALGADDELIVPLRRFLGVPDPMPNGLVVAMKAGILADVGGVKEMERRRLEQFSDSGVRVTVIVPPGESGKTGVRLIASVRAKEANSEILVQPAPARAPVKKGQIRARNLPDIDLDKALRIPVERISNPSTEWVEVSRTLPNSFGARPGTHLSLSVYAPQGVEIRAIAAVPLRSDVPPPPPKPWKPSEAETD